MRRITASLFVLAVSCFPRPATAEPLLEFHWAGAEAAARAGEGSNTEALLETMDPEAIADAARRVKSALIQRADDPDLAEGVGIVERLWEVSFASPMTVWFDAGAVPGEMPEGGVAWAVGDEAAARGLEADLLKLLSEAGQSPDWTVRRTPEGEVSFLFGDPAGEAPAAPPAREAVLSLRADVARLVDLGVAVAQRELPLADQETLNAVLAVLHPRGFEQLHIRQFFSDGLWATEARVVAPAPRRGLAKLLLEPPAIEDVDLAAVPADAPLVAAFGFDPAAAWALAREALAAVDPGMVDSLDQLLADARDGTGADLQAGFIDALGTSHVLFQDPAIAGQSTLGLVATNLLRDPEAFEDASATLIDLANVIVDAETADLWISGRAFTSELDGVAVTTVPLPGIAPSWAVVEGRLIVGLFPQSLAAVLDRLDAGGADILTNGGFAATLARGRASAAAAGADGVTSVSFVDLPELAPQAYGSLLVLEHLGTGLASMASREPVPAVLPPFARIRPLLSPASGAGWPTEEGSVSAAVAPFPAASMLAGGGGGGTQMLFVLPGAIGAAVEGMNTPDWDDPYNGAPIEDEPFFIPPPPPSPEAPEAPAPGPPAPPSPF